MGAPPPDPRAYGGWGLCPHTPKPLAAGGLRLQTPIGLRRLGGSAPRHPKQPPHCEFLATRLIEPRSYVSSTGALNHSAMAAHARR